MWVGRRNWRSTFKWCSAMCPSCHILLVESTNDYLNNLAAAATCCGGPREYSLSNSYGGSEGGLRFEPSAIIPESRLPSALATTAMASSSRRLRRT